MEQLISKVVTAALKARLVVLIGSVVLIIAGVSAMRTLPIEAYPELANPQVRVITLYPGKGPEEVERLVTIPLEKELNGIPGQTALRSISLYGLSVVIATFTESTQTALARQQALERTQNADLPPDAEPKMEPDVGSLREIFRYILVSPFYSPMGLRTIQQWNMEKLFRQIPGVIGVVSHGGPTKTYQVNVYPDKLSAFGLSLKQVYDALERSNATTGGGYLDDNGQALIVRQLGLIRGVEDVKRIVLSTTEQGTPVIVGDVADVTIGPKVRLGQVGKNQDKDVVEGILLLRRGENPTKVLEEVDNRLPEIRKQLPPGVELKLLYDRNALVNRTLQTVATNVAIGISLVIIFLSIFLSNVRAALVTALAVPTSMFVAYITLSALGVPANLLSLGAIDFGILVDGAVVMTENIIRRLSEEGKDLDFRERLLLLTEAGQEVAAPIFFGIVSIIITFLPIFALSGVEGRLFRPLAITMVAALIGSAIAALTIVPVLCSLFLVQRPIDEKQSFLVSGALALYKPALKWSIRHTKTVVSLTVLGVVLSGFVFTQVGSEFLPHLEEGNIWLRATVKPASVTLNESVGKAEGIRETLMKYPEVTLVLSQVGGPDDGTDPARFADQEHLIDLKPKSEWREQFHEDKDQLIAAMRRDLEQITGVDYYFTQYIQTTLDEALSGVQGSLVAKIVGPDLEELESLGERVGSMMRNTRGIVDVIVDPLIGQPQLMIEIDRAAAARYGLSVEDIKDLTEMAIGGKPATTVIEGENRFDVILRFAESYRADKYEFDDLLIDTPSGARVPLSQLATVKQITGATQIWREAGSRMATVRANVRGRDLASSVAEAQARVEKEIKLPPGYQVVWSGEFQRQGEALRQLAIVIPVTLVVILIVLFLSSGSVKGALVMFSVVPMACIGAVFSLFLTKTYFSISAGVGFICLFGLAVKNSILLLSFVNDLRTGGASLQRAVYQGALIRLRPVLMTATIAAAGLLPAALSNEIGAQTQRPFAIVIIGGLITSTALTLFVLPALYQWLAPRLKRQKSQGSLAAQAEVIK